jgi:hypothetical protein
MIGMSSTRLELINVRGLGCKVRCTPNSGQTFAAQRTQRCANRVIALGGGVTHRLSEAALAGIGRPIPARQPQIH